MNISETCTEMMTLLERGYSNEEIAKSMNVSSHTVKWYIANVMRTLNAKNRTHAACIFRDMEYKNALSEAKIDISNLKIPPLT